ncbi:MAG TPA: hypothetical protein VFN90_11230 [Gemmatimonadales bacterium]|nr:hypothetical protein [Gemmatimonadales bacterium]
MQPRFHPSDRRGVTLATSLLLILLLTVAVVAAFVRTSGDRRTTLDQVAAVDAYAVAQNGVDRYLTVRTTEPTSFPDSSNVNVPGGTAAVRIRRLRAKTGNVPSLYAVTSTGWTTGNRYDARAARAYRSVTQLVEWSEATLNGTAALTSLNGIDQQGQPATYDGRDTCDGVQQASSNWVPGLQMVDASDFEKSGNQNPPQIYGSAGNTIVDMGTLADALDQLGFVWDNVTSMVGSLPNVVRVPPTNNTDDFNDFAFPPKTQQPWPILLVDNAGGPAYTSNAPGHGILVVTGDFATSGNAFTWDGLVLVGGKMTVNGNSTWTGSVFAGLNNDDPNNPDVVFPDNLINGNKTFQYSKCAVTRALTAFAGWTKIPNARADNVPSY